MTTMDRFKPPTAADDRAACMGCGDFMHYTALDDSGRCQNCRPDNTCQRCGGVGEIKDSLGQWDWSTAAAAWATCPDCKGTGEA